MQHFKVWLLVAPVLVLFLADADAAVKAREVSKAHQLLATGDYKRDITVAISPARHQPNSL